MDVVVNYIREHADKTAFNWMIDDKVYQSIKYCSDAIEELDVIKSFYVYRLASDKFIDYSSKMYQEYNRLIKEVAFDDIDKYSNKNSINDTMCSDVIWSCSSKRISSK